MTIREDRNQHRFKNWQICRVWMLPFCYHRAIKLTQNCVYFTNPCIDLFVPSSATREDHRNVLERRSLSLHTALGYWIDITPRSFQSWFLVPLGYPHQKHNQVHVEGPVQRMQAVPNSPHKANGWSGSFQQWHHCLLGYDCLSNSYRLWKRVLTAHTLIGVQHPWWTVVT